MIKMIIVLVFCLEQKSSMENLLLVSMRFERSPLSASEIDGIAELGLSGLGKTFKVLGPDDCFIWTFCWSYPKESQFVPDPNCEKMEAFLMEVFVNFYMAKDLIL